MATFKLNIADPKQGKTYKKEVKEEEAKPFLGLNIGETVKGEVLGMTGFEFKVSGGSDYCGFPMRSGIQGSRKKVTIMGGVGFSGAEKGIGRGKTVCGHKIHDKISQINLTMTKAGASSLPKALGIEEKPEEAPKEEKKVEAKAEPKGENKVEEKPKEEPKAETKQKEEKKVEEKPKEEKKAEEEPPKEEPKAEAKEDKK